MPRFFIRHVKTLRTTVWSVEVPHADMEVLLTTAFDYMDRSKVSGEDLDIFKWHVFGLCGVLVTDAVEIHGRVGNDVVMLYDWPLKRHVVCLDVRNDEDGHLAIWMCENEQPQLARIDVTVLKTWRLFHRLVLQGTNEELYHSDADGPIPGSNGDAVVMRERPDDPCLNCGYNTRHEVHGWDKYCDAKQVVLCVPCYRTLALPVLDVVRWSTCFKDRGSEAVSIPLGSSERVMGIIRRNVQVTCAGCQQWGLAVPLLVCDRCPSFAFCQECHKSVQEKHCFGHTFEEMHYES